MPKLSLQERTRFVGKLGRGKELSMKAVASDLFKGSVPVMGQALPAGSMVGKPLSQVGLGYCPNYQWFIENTDQDVEMYPRLAGGLLTLVVNILDMDSRQVISSEEEPIMSAEAGKDIGTTMHTAMLRMIRALNIEIATQKGLIN